MATVLAASDERPKREYFGSPHLNFNRLEFLEIVYVEKPKTIYRFKNLHFFFLVGLMISTSECESSDFEKSLVVTLPCLERVSV